MLPPASISVGGPNVLVARLRLHHDMMEKLASMAASWHDRSLYSDHGALRLLKTLCGDNPPDSVDTALDILVDGMVTEFGYVPRDIFQAMLRPEGYDAVLQWHAGVSSVEPRDLCGIMSSRIYDTYDPQRVPHRAACLRPLTKVGEYVGWTVDFKTLTIAKRVLAKCADAQEETVRQLMQDFAPQVLSPSSILGEEPMPEGRTFVAWLFEPLAHRRLQSAGGDEDRWPLKPMTMQEPSVFVLDPATESVPMIPKVNRRRVYLDAESIATQLSELKDDEYYVFNPSAFPFIDSFIVSLNSGAKTPSADLWLLQMAMSASHGGSPRGYATIRTIVSILRKQLDEAHAQRDDSDSEPPAKRHKPAPKRRRKTGRKAQIRVHYVLVGEKVETRRWTLPAGWDAGTIQGGHRGDGYVLEIDIGASAYYSSINRCSCLCELPDGQP